MISLSKWANQSESHSSGRELLLNYRDQHGPVLGDDLTIRKMIEEGRP